MKKVVIVSAARTPIGAFGGSLRSVSAVQLGTIAANAALDRAGIKPEMIDEVYIGNVLSAGAGQNVARQVAVKAGIPIEVPAMSLNILCGSGLRSVSLAAQVIASGGAEIILCGGTESMSNAPYLNAGQRFGSKLGSVELIDHMINDGLIDAFEGYHMGVTAEHVADKWSISREAQDNFAVASQNKAELAQKNGVFKDEIIPVVVEERRGQTKLISDDEHIRENVTMDDLSKLKPAFKKEGTVTAGNASGINDGAAMLVVMCAERAAALGIEPLAEIVSHATVGVDPSIMGIGPVPATRKALSLANWKANELDLIEANEAFAAQAIAVANELDLDLEKVNVNGGAIALGHPIGASGARILTTLIYEMKRRNASKGLATLCIGGGMGTSLLISMSKAK